MKITTSDLIRRDRMAFDGANYECKKCGGKIDIDRDVEYTERDAKAAAEHDCK